MSNFSNKDIQVFNFINSEKCTSYWKLESFLIENHLPIYESWLFYFWGKVKLTNQELHEETTINELSSDSPEMLLRMLEMWKTKLEQSKDIIESIKDEDQYSSLSKNELWTIFINRTWEYIQNSIEEEIESRKDYYYEKLLDDYQAKQMQNPRNYKEYQDNFCDACQSDPCMCSDPQ